MFIIVLIAVALRRLGTARKDIARGDGKASRRPDPKPRHDLKSRARRGG